MSRPAFEHTNVYLSLFFAVVAACLVLVWVPLDTGSGLIETLRRQVTIGDALAPTLAGVLIFIGAVMVFFQPRGTYPNGISVANLLFLAALLTIFSISFALMRWAGPLAAAIADFTLSQDIGYRLRRDMVPWKYIGFILGGVMLVASLIGAIEGRLTLRALLLALITVSGLIGIFDLPFDDLLLPPNGDV